jgi:hypothetical protein
MGDDALIRCVLVCTFIVIRWLIGLVGPPLFERLRGFEAFLFWASDVL